MYEALGILVDAALKGTVVLLGALVVTMVLRRVSAARRHLIWCAAVTALLLVPLLSFVLPAWGVLPTVSTITELPLTSPAEAPAAAAPVSALPVSSSVPGPTTSGNWTDSPSASRAGFSIMQIFGWVWLFGSALVLLSIAAGFARVHWLARRAVVLRSGRVYDATHALCATKGLRVQLLRGDVDTMPMTWGWRRASLLIPAAAEQWSETRLHAVLRHELAHVQRRDALWQLMAELACALHWFNPLVWYAAHRMRVEREHACDDAVLIGGSRPSEYAAELLDIARSMRAARATSLAAMAMARPRQLEGRLLAVLDARRNRNEAARRWPVWVAAALMVLPLAAVSPSVEQAAALPTQDIGVAPGARTWRPAVRVAPGPVMLRSAIAGSTVAGQAPNCQASEIRQMSTSISSDDDRSHTRVKWATRDCKGTLEINGDAKIAGDLTRFQSISAGGRVRIETRDPRSSRKLTLTPSEGRFLYAYEVDGKRRGWDNDGQVWLTSILTLLVRHAGYGAEERVDYLLREKGVAGVIEEVGLMTSDHTQRRYLTLLLNKTTLKPREVHTLLEVAGRELASDYELGELLVATTRKYGFTAETRTPYLNAVRSLESDYERSKAILALLNSRSLNEDGQVAVLELAAEIRSSYERGRVLKQMMNQSGRLEARFQEAYLKAANVDSDYEVGQMLSAILLRQRLVPSAIDVALTVIGTIRSDYERAQALSKLINTQTLTSAQQSRAADLTDEIRSEYERGKVASLLLRKMKN